MGLKRPQKNVHKIISCDLTSVSTSTSSCAPSVIMRNYYEAGPSGVQWTNWVLDVKIPNDPCPMKHPWLHSPPPASAGEQTWGLAPLSDLMNLGDWLMDIATNPPPWPHSSTHRPSTSAHGLSSKHLSVTTSSTGSGPSKCTEKKEGL